MLLVFIFIDWQSITLFKSALFPCSWVPRLYPCKTSPWCRRFSWFFCSDRKSPILIPPPPPWLRSCAEYFVPCSVSTGASVLTYSTGRSFSSSISGRVFESIAMVFSTESSTSYPALSSIFSLLYPSSSAFLSMLAACLATRALISSSVGTSFLAFWSSLSTISPSERSSLSRFVSYY